MSTGIEGTMILTALLIFIFRTLDVLVETVRLLLTVDKHKTLVSAIAFVEVLAWVWIFNALVVPNKSWWCYAAYAGGYACGSYLGIILGGKAQIYMNSRGKEK
jgi:uncharacterized protein YebE (UPF0316 family)